MDSFLEALSFLANGLFFYVLSFLFALFILVSLHEFGHFFVARKFGIRIEKFSFGFGRELWGRTDKKGTRWSISLWPLGGYVKIFGDCDPLKPEIWDTNLKKYRPLTTEELAVAFCTKPVWKRLSIVLAGPLANFLFALIVLVCIYSNQGQRSLPPVINAIDINSASYEAGFRLGDEIISFDEKPVRRFEDIYDQTMKEYNHPNTYKILREGKVLELQLQPREEKFTDTMGIVRSNGRTGMSFFNALNFNEIVSVDDIPTDKNPNLARDLLSARFDKIVKIGIKYRIDETSPYLMIFPSKYNGHLSNPQDKDYNLIFTKDRNTPYLVRLGISEALFRTLGKIMEVPSELYKRVVARISGKNDEQMINGIGKISKDVGDSAQSGIYSYIIFLCIFSLQLAIINLFPIPVLDGGYVVFLLYEAIFRKPVPQKMQYYALIIGMALLVGIMVIANVSDFLYFLR